MMIDDIPAPGPSILTILGHQKNWKVPAPFFSVFVEDKLPDGWSAERFKIVEGGAARVGIKGTHQKQQLGPSPRAGVSCEWHRGEFTGLWNQAFHRDKNGIEWDNPTLSRETRQILREHVGIWWVLLAFAGRWQGSIFFPGRWHHYLGAYPRSLTFFYFRVSSFPAVPNRSQVPMGPQSPMNKHTEKLKKNLWLPLKFIDFTKTTLIKSIKFR